MSKAPLACDPGTHWIYGFSSELAAGIIEAVCDKPVNDVFKEMLFDPLGMKDTAAIFQTNRRRTVLSHSMPKILMEILFQDLTFLIKSISLEKKMKPDGQDFILPWKIIPDFYRCLPAVVSMTGQGS